MTIQVIVNRIGQLSERRTVQVSDSVPVSIALDIAELVAVSNSVYQSTQTSVL
jgi:uncharacterized membrane protein